MKKQTYIKPQTETVAIETIDLMAATTVPSVLSDGSGISLTGEVNTGGDAATATAKDSYDIWDLDEE